MKKLAILTIGIALIASQGYSYQPGDTDDTMPVYYYPTDPAVPEELGNGSYVKRSDYEYDAGWGETIKFENSFTNRVFIKWLPWLQVELSDDNLYWYLPIYPPDNKEQPIVGGGKGSNGSGTSLWVYTTNNTAANGVNAWVTFKNVANLKGESTGLEIPTSYIFKQHIYPATSTTHPLAVVPAANSPDWISANDLNLKQFECPVTVSGTGMQAESLFWIWSRLDMKPSLPTGEVYSNAFKITVQHSLP